MLKSRWMLFSYKFYIKNNRLCIQEMPMPGVYHFSTCIEMRIFPRSTCIPCILHTSPLRSGTLRIRPRTPYRSGLWLSSWRVTWAVTPCCWMSRWGCGLGRSSLRSHCWGWTFPGHSRAWSFPSWRTSWPCVEGRGHWQRTEPQKNGHPYPSPGEVICWWKKSTLKCVINEFESHKDYLPINHKALPTSVYITQSSN